MSSPLRQPSTSPVLTLIVQSGLRGGAKPASHGSRGLAALSLAVAAVLASAGAATAATSIFDGDAAIGNAGDNTLWATANNWTTGGVNDVAPSNVAPGDDLTFGGGTAGAIIDLGGNRFANSLTFNRNYTLGAAATANTLTLATAPISVTSGNTGTINAVLAGSAGLNITGGGTFVLNRTGNTFTGSITVDGAGTTLAFVGSGTADQTSLGAAGARSVTLTNGATISVITTTANPSANTKSFVFGTGGATANVATGLTLQLDDAGQFSGTGAVTKTGNGILFLNNQAFTYTGSAVNVNAGTLRVGANGGVLGTGTVPINVAIGATYDNLIALTGTKNVTVGGTGVGGNGALISTGTAGSIGGTVTLTADTTVGGTGTLTIGGIIGDGADTFNLTKVGAGVVVLNGANTFGGNVTINGGTLRGTSNTGIPATANLNVTDGVFETANASFTRVLGAGAGQVQVTGGASGFSSQVAAANINLGGAAATVQFGSASFNPTAFVLNASSANNPITFANPLDLNGATRTIAVNAAVANTATTAGVISDSTNTVGALTKSGTGVLILGATNTYTGATTVSAGSLRGALGTNIPAGSNLVLNGGAYETGVNLTVALGTAGGEVQLPGGTSGFSAFGAPVTVNLGGAGAAVQFGAATFNPTSLLLNQGSANNTIDFQNAIDLNAANRSITVNANVATVSGAISTSAGTAGLTKAGAGVLVLGNAANSYNGTTTVSAGALRATDAASLPTTSNLTLNGGVFEPSADFTRAIGTGAGQVQLTGGASGFSAFGAPVAVNLGGASAAVQWGGATFNPSSLVLNAASANNTVEFQNPIDLNGASRTFAGNNGTFAGTVSGVISTGTGTAGVTVNGTGILAFSGNNTYNGTTTLTAGTLSVGAVENLGAATAPVVFGGGTLRVTGTTLQNLTGRTVTFNANTAIGLNIADAANNFTIGTAFVAGQTLNKSGAGTLSLGAPLNILTFLNVNGGTIDLGNNILQVNNGGSTTIRTVSGSGTINASGTGSIALTVSDGDAGAANGTTLTINAPITGAFRYENFVATNGTGVTILANPNNSYSGGTAINSSVLSVSVINNTGQNGNLGTGGTINIANAGSTLRYTGTGETTDRIIAMTGTTLGAILEMAGTGTLRITGNVAAPGAGSKTLTLIGSTAGVGELAGIIPNNSATNTTSITKNGTGTWKLSGLNSFTGGVTVTQGNLIITNSSSLGTGTKNIALSNGTAGTPQLFLDGSAGNITLPNTFTYQTSVNTTASAGAFINVAGDNTIQGVINPVSGGGDTGIVVNGGTLTISANVTQAANNALRNLRLRGVGNGSLTGTISNGIAGATIGIIQEGTGIWAITGNSNTYSGATNVTSGTLLANNTSGSATGTSAVSVSGTGTFGGSGAVTGNVSVNSGGTLAPGNGIGLFGTGALNFATDSHLALQFASTTPGTGYDQVNVTGTVNLTGGDIQLSLGAFTPLNDDLFYILLNDSNDAITGTFAGLGDGSIFSAGGQDFKISYAANWTGDQGTSTFTGGNDIALQAVPEPASAMFLLAGVGLLARRRRG